MTTYQPTTRTETHLTLYICDNQEHACRFREIGDSDHQEATDSAAETAVSAAETVWSTMPDVELEIKHSPQFSDWNGGWIGGLRHGYGMAPMIAEQRTITTTVDEDGEEWEDELEWQQIDPTAEMLKIVEAAGDAYEAELCRFEREEAEKAAKFKAEEAEEMEEV